MGELEAEVKKATRRTKLRRIILNSIFSAGVLSVALLAPNALQALKMFDAGRARKKNPKYAINEALQRLIAGGFVQFEKTDRGTFLRLTPKGEKCIDILDRHDYKLKKPGKWDGKWRIITFDIKEKRRGLRSRVRDTLSKIGFVRLQNSVWVYPYDCEDLMILLKADFKIGKDMLYVIADKIEYDLPLRKQFGL